MRVIVNCGTPSDLIYAMKGVQYLQPQDTRCTVYLGDGTTVHLKRNKTSVTATVVPAVEGGFADD